MPDTRAGYPKFDSERLTETSEAAKDGMSLKDTTSLDEVLPELPQEVPPVEANGPGSRVYTVSGKTLSIKLTRVVQNVALASGCPVQIVLSFFFCVCHFYTAFKTQWSFFAVSLSHTIKLKLCFRVLCVVCGSR